MSYRVHRPSLGLATLTPQAQRSMREEQARQVAARTGITTVEAIREGIESGRTQITTARPDSLIPSQCDAVWRESYEAPPATVPAGRPFVAAFPLVSFGGSEEKAQKYLDLFLPRPDVALTAAEQLVAFVAEGERRRFGAALVLWANKYVPVGLANPPETRMELRYFAAGWVPETSRTAQTRGVLWFAFAFDKAMATQQMQRYAQRLLWAAEDLGAGRVGGRGAVVDPIEQAVEKNVVDGLSDITIQMGHTPSVAASMQDAAVLSAVYNSALGLAQFGSGLRVMFQLADGRREVARINDQVQSAAQSAREAYELYRGVSQIELAVDTAIAQALAGEPVAGQTILDNAQGVVRTAQSKIRAGLAAAPAVLQLAAELEPTLKPAIKNIIKRAADEVAARSDAVAFSMMKEYTYCAAYRGAERTFQQVKTELDTAIATATQPAQALVAEQEGVLAAIQKLDGLIAKIDRAKEQLPLEWWQRTKGGLPVWGWMAGGAAVLLGGAVAVRVIKRRKRPTPNGRRRRPRR